MPGGWLAKIEGWAVVIKNLGGSKGGGGGGGEGWGHL